MNPGGSTWLGLLGAQWLMIWGTLLTLVLLMEAFLGHYRSGFTVRMQYSPFVVGLGLLGAFTCGIALPRAEVTRLAFRIAGWSAILLSAVGVGFHWYYGVVEKPGGVRWLLHHLMYHAPLFAPLGLAVAGGVALIAEASLGGHAVIGNLSPPRFSVILTAAALSGLMIQVAILHYRGAFKNPAMYAPLIVPLFALGAALWHLVWTGGSGNAYVAALWLTLLLGFGGWGWHLRGLDRMMAGLYVSHPNLLEGPPPVAPLLFALVAAVGIVGARLL